MTEFDFKMMFSQLCTNYSKNTNTDAMQLKGDMFYEKYKGVSTEVFKKTIDLVMERHGAVYGFFPSIKEISSCLKEAQGSSGEEVEGCGACDNAGGVSLLIAFKENNNKKGVDERHIWSLPLDIDLKTNNSKRFYTYNACCRCELGQNLFARRKGKTFQLTGEEYNKITKERSAMVKKDRQMLMQEEEGIPF